MEEDKSQNCHGNICLRLESVEDYTQVNRFCQYLDTIANLEIASRSWSEKEGLEVFICLKDPFPLSDKLRQSALVDEVHKTKKRVYTVVFNNSEGGTLSPRLALSEVGLFM
jgi:hypothetical protein